MTTDRRGSRATWLSLAVAGPVASAVFAGSLAWAAAVTPKGDATGTTAPAPTAPTTTAQPVTPTTATQATPAQQTAPITHAKTGASK